MKHSSLALLLRRVHSNQSLSSMMTDGYTPVQISQIILEAQRQELISWDEQDNPRVTERGKRFLHDKSIHGNDGAGWVEPLILPSSDRLGVFDIYIPSKRTLKKLTHRDND